MGSLFVVGVVPEEALSGFEEGCVRLSRCKREA